MTNRILTLGVPVATAAYVITNKNMNTKTKQMILIGSGGVALFLNSDIFFNNLTSGIVSGVSQSIDGLGQGLAKGIDSLAKGLLSTLGDVTGEIADTVGDLAEDAFNSVKDVFETTTQSISDWFQSEKELQDRPDSQEIVYSPYEKEAVLRSMYNILLHRRIDKGGFDYWIKYLNKGDKYYEIAKRLEAGGERKNIIKHRNGEIYTINEIENWLAMINIILYHGNINPHKRKEYIVRMKRYSKYKGKENKDSTAWMVLDQMDRANERPERYKVLTSPDYMEYQPPEIGDLDTSQKDIESRWKMLFKDLFDIFWNIPKREGYTPIRQVNSIERLTGLVLSGAPLHEIISGNWLITKSDKFDSWKLMSLRDAFYHKCFINLIPDKELTESFMAEVDTLSSNYADCAFHIEPLVNINLKN